MRFVTSIAEPTLSTNGTAAIASERTSRKNRLKNNLRLKFHKNFIYRFLRDLRHFNKYKMVIVEGKKAGFTNILECAGFVGYDFLNKYGNKS